MAVALLMDGVVGFGAGTAVPRPYYLRARTVAHGACANGATCLSPATGIVPAFIRSMQDRWRYC
jgi:hypothetical protein